MNDQRLVRQPFRECPLLDRLQVLARQPYQSFETWIVADVVPARIVFVPFSDRRRERISVCAQKCALNPVPKPVACRRYKTFLLLHLASKATV